MASEGQKVSGLEEGVVNSSLNTITQPHNNPTGQPRTQNQHLYSYVNITALAVRIPPSPPVLNPIAGS